MFQNRFCLRDAVAAAFVLLCAILLLLFPAITRSDGEWLVITTPEGAQSYRLDKAQTFTVSSHGITLTVAIENGSARVLHSDCPDGVCRQSRAIKKSGETILCAPAGITLSVRGGGSDVDFVAG